MTKTKYYHEEDRPLLVLALDSQEFRLSQPGLQYEAAVTRGAANYLGRWPAHLLAAFVAGFFVFATVLLVGIVTVILTIPAFGEERRTPQNIDANYHLPNIYFIKHENRTWTPLEFCYIETTARTYKNLSIYLINLLDENEIEKNLSKIGIEVFQRKNEAVSVVQRILKQDDHKTVSMNRKSPAEGSERRENLVAFNANIKTIDVSIRRFFNGSRLAKIFNHLSKEMIEMAAKAYVLWNFPGVALDPKMYPDLESLKEYLSKSRIVNDENNRCGKDSTAAIEVDGYIQASSEPCQAFLDQLIRQISMSESSDQKYALKKAISNFCPRPSRCRGVRVFNRIPETAGVSKEKLDCPTIIPANGAERNFENMQNALKMLNERELKFGV